MDQPTPTVPELPEDLTVLLRKPVTLGSMTYSELKLREPTAAEWQQWDKLEGIDGDIKAVSVVSGVPEPAIRLIGARDLIQASRYIGAFLS